MAVTRIATPEDAEALMALINAAFIVERFFIDVERIQLEEVRQLQQSGVFVVTGEMAACVYVELRGDRGYMGLLSVDPKRQGTGLGRMMVEAAEEYAREKACGWMDLRVVSVRDDLPPFYRKLGYAEAGTEPFDSEHPTKMPVHLVRMEKRLTT
jgi:GNAT superfamily N-acetyltransferase